MVLVGREMNSKIISSKSKQPRPETLFATSVSYDDNHFATGTFFFSALNLHKVIDSLKYFVIPNFLFLNLLNFFKF